MYLKLVIFVPYAIKTIMNSSFRILGNCMQHNFFSNVYLQHRYKKTWGGNMKVQCAPIRSSSSSSYDIHLRKITVMAACWNRLFNNIDLKLVLIYLIVQFWHIKSWLPLINEYLITLFYPKKWKYIIHSCSFSV